LEALTMNTNLINRLPLLALEFLVISLGFAAWIAFVVVLASACG